MERMRSCLLLGLTLSAALHADTYPRQPGIDVQHYVFRITLSDESDEISGETTVAVRFVKDGVTQVALDLGEGMKVAEVTGGKHRREGEKLLISPEITPKSGEIRVFSVK